VEFLIVEAFQSASQILEAFERLTLAAWRHASERDVAHQTVETANAAPEIAASDGIIVCTIKEACTRTGLGRTDLPEAIGSGELRAIKMRPANADRDERNSTVDYIIAEDGAAMAPQKYFVFVEGTGPLWLPVTFDGFLPALKHAV
jgi:hypothetical protein